VNNSLPPVFAWAFALLAFLPPATGNAASVSPHSSAEPRVVIASEAGAKLDSDVLRGGGSDDTALIQSILDRAPKLGALKWVVDGPILVSGIRVYSNTTLECLNRGCGFYIADNSNRPLISNASPQAEGRADSNLSFVGGTVRTLDLQDIHLPATTKTVKQDGAATVGTITTANVNIH
jgi:hypothetical protein